MVDFQANKNICPIVLSSNLLFYNFSEQPCKLRFIIAQVLGKKELNGHTDVKLRPVTHAAYCCQRNYLLDLLHNPNA